MRKIEEYLLHATECREMARTAQADHRHQLEKMAETWEQLAETRRKQLDRRSQGTNLDDEEAIEPELEQVRVESQRGRLRVRREGEDSS